MPLKNFFRLLSMFLIVTSILNSCKKEDEIVDNTDPIVKVYVNEINADSIKKNVEWLQNMGTRFALADNRKEVALKIKERFIRYGYASTTLDSFFITKTYRSVVYNTWQYNVIATLNGSVYEDNYYIVGGHYDCITYDDPLNNAPGANDNASGVAAALEIARVFNKNAFNPKNTIQFIAFAAEELGLYGSKDYAKKAYEQNKNILLMLNNDMIAHWPTDNNFRVNIIDYDNSMDCRLMAETVCEKYTSLSTNNDNTYQAYSDSYPFYQNGYKALFFISDAGDPYYHTINDLTSTKNFEFCREVTKISCAMLVEANK